MRLENGSDQTVMKGSIEGLRVGDRVPIDKWRAYRYRFLYTESRSGLQANLFHYGVGLSFD